MHAAIYVQDFTSGERGVRQEQNCIYDFFDFTHPAHGVQSFQRLIGLGFMHRSFDDAQGNGVHTNAILGILNCECARDRMQTALAITWTATGTPAIGWSTRAVDTLTMLPLFCCNIRFTANCET